MLLQRVMKGDIKSLLNSENMRNKCCFEHFGMGRIYFHHHIFCSIFFVQRFFLFSE